MNGFIENTLIYTAAGFKNINEVSTDDSVLNENNEFKQILDIQIRKSSNTYKLKGMCFDEIICADEQKFLVKEKISIFDKTRKCKIRKFKEPIWKYAKELSKDDYMCISINNNQDMPNWNGSIYNQFNHHRRLNNLEPLFNNPYFWYIMGRFVGDGWTRKTYQNSQSYRGGITICCSKIKEDDFTKLKEAFDKCNLHTIITEERTVYRFSTYSVELYEFVERYGNRALTKSIDADTMNLPENLLIYFLKGYKDSDGTFTQDKYKLTSVSRNLIYTTAQCIAKAHKIHYHIYHSPMPSTCIIENRIVNCHDQYQLVWDTNMDKTYKAFYENGHIWFPLKDVSYINKPTTVYEIIASDGSYNAFSVVTK